MDLSKNKITGSTQMDRRAWKKICKYLELSKKLKLDSLPPQFGDLSNLKYFIMNRSELQRLPHTIGKMKELRYMDFWGSNLSYFPFELRYLSETLQTLRLQDVLISGPLQKALKAELPYTTIEFTPPCACEQ